MTNVLRKADQNRLDCVPKKSASKFVRPYQSYRLESPAAFGVF